MSFFYFVIENVQDSFFFFKKNVRDSLSGFFHQFVSVLMHVLKSLLYPCLKKKKAFGNCEDKDT